MCIRDRRYIAASQAGIGEHVVRQSGELLRGFVPRKDGYGLAAAAQQGRDSRESGPEVAVCVVASRGDHSVGSHGVVVIPYPCRGIDPLEFVDRISDQHAVFRRGLDQAAMPRGHHAQQVEQTDQRKMCIRDSAWMSCSVNMSPSATL